MKNVFRVALACLLCGFVSVGWAGHSEPPKPTPPAQTTNNQNKQGQAQHQGQHQGQNQTANGGAGGNAAANAPTDVNVEGSEASAQSSQSLSQNYNQVRQVPTLLQGDLLVNDCGAGINAGGADTGGAGFLGAVWTTGRCYALKSGSNFAAIGDYETACDLWVDVNRKAFKRIGRKPDCRAIAERLYAQSITQLPPTPVDPPVDMSQYVTKKELAERDRRIIQRMFEK